MFPDWVEKRWSFGLHQWKLSTTNCRQSSLGLDGIHKAISVLGLWLLCWRSFEWSEFWNENHFLNAEIFIIYPGFKTKKEKPWPIFAATCKIVSNFPRKSFPLEFWLAIGATPWNATVFTLHWVFCKHVYLISRSFTCQRLIVWKEKQNIQEKSSGTFSRSRRCREQPASWRN